MPYAMARHALQRRAIDDSKPLQWLTESALFRYLYFGFLFKYADANDEIQKRFAGVLADTVKPSFEALSELSRAHQFKVMVAVFPLFPRKKTEDFQGYPYLSEHAYVRSLSQENAFINLDLLETFRACAKDGPVAIDIYHPNERGHRCAAAALAEQIQRMRPTGS